MQRFPIGLRLLAAAAVLSAAAARPSLADTWWVKAGASGDGTAKDKPAGKLAPVLAGARRGDVIHVAKGEYNGRDDTGEFAVNVPNLTLVGGWNDDFSARDPFANLTILRRKAGLKGVNYTNTLGGIIATDPDAHADARMTSASGLILDGFVLDGSTRNVYNPSDKRLASQGSWKEGLIKLTAADPYCAANIKIRNCVLFNCYNPAIEIKWQGDQNEVSNCLIFNNMIAGIDARAAQGPMNAPGAPKDYPATKLLIKNTTVGFTWEHDKAQMGNCILLGGAGSFTIQDNVLCWASGASASGVRGCRDGDVVTGNVFFVTSDAQKITGDQATAKQMGGGKRDEEEEEEGSGGGAGAKIADNVNADPGFHTKLDKAWFGAFSGMAAKFGKIALEVVNPLREAAGLPVVEKLGAAMAPADCAWGVAYPPEQLAEAIAAFKAAQEGKGFQAAGPFASYEERKEPALLGFEPGPKDDYAEIDFSALEDGAANAPADGAKVKFKANLRTRANRWGDVERGITVDNYVHFELGKPGVTGNTPLRLFGYAVRGSQAGNRWNEFGSKNMAGKTKDGVWIRGVVTKSSQAANPKVPWVVVVDYIGAP